MIVVLGMTFQVTRIPFPDFIQADLEPDASAMHPEGD